MRVLKLRSSIESEIDPMRVNGNVDEGVAWPDRKRVTCGYGVVSVIDQLRRVRRFRQYKRARRQRQFFDSEIERQ